MVKKLRDNLLSDLIIIVIISLILGFLLGNYLDVKIQTILIGFWLLILIIISNRLLKYWR